MIKTPSSPNPAFKLLSAHKASLEDMIETLCHGCDTPLGPDRYCASCGEVMPVYEWERDRPAIYSQQKRRAA